MSIVKDVAYRSDPDRGHHFDIYRLPDTANDAPVIINIHGGGLFASYKEVNRDFNYELARRGFCVVSLSYRRIPQTTLWHQIDDVMAALRFLETNRDRFNLNLDRCYLTGDSAGALLSLFALALTGSVQLQDKFGIKGPSFAFRAAALISIMLHTHSEQT